MKIGIAITLVAFFLTSPVAGSVVNWGSPQLDVVAIGPGNRASVLDCCSPPTAFPPSVLRLKPEFRL